MSDIHELSRNEVCQISGVRSSIPEATPRGIQVRPAEEIFHGLGAVALLHRDDGSLSAQFMQGQMDALESFFDMGPGWPVLKSEVGLHELSRRYADLRQLQKNGHLVGALKEQGELAGLGWGINERKHLYERLSGGRYHVVKL